MLSPYFWYCTGELNPQHHTVFTVEPILLFPWSQLLNSSGHLQTWHLSWGLVTQRANISPGGPEGGKPLPQVQPLLLLLLLSVCTALTPVNIGKSIYFNYRWVNLVAFEALKIPWNTLGVPKLVPTQKTLLLGTIELHIFLTTLFSSCNFILSWKKGFLYTEAFLKRLETWMHRQHIKIWHLWCSFCFEILQDNDP